MRSLLPSDPSIHQPMKTALLTYSVSRADGGIFEVTRRVAQSLAAQEHLNVEVLGLEDVFTQADLPQWHPLRPKTFRHRGPRLCGYAPGLAQALEESDADVLHIHGIWSYYTLAGYDWSKRRQRPYLLTTHGMLSSRALQVARWKKVIVDAVFKTTVLRSARCLQAFTRQELADIRGYGLRNPVCVIPNGIDLPEYVPAGPPPWRDCVRPGRKVLLYLGRLHQIKGLPNLLQAWTALLRDSHCREWDLVIAGWGQAGHETELKAQVEAAGLGDSVHFPGPQFGEAKAASYYCADAFILPSHSEGLPMAVLEAWAYSLPVLMTPQCNLPEGFAANAALAIEPTVPSIAEGLVRLFDMSAGDRREMGQRGRYLVADRFSWSNVAASLNEVYQWTLGSGSQPACVVTE